MVSTLVSTPIKSHAGLFSARTAGGRMLLTPSPRQSSKSTPKPINLDSSPFSPVSRPSVEYGDSPKSVYGGNLMPHFARSASKPGPRRESPKSNIACSTSTPRKVLDLTISEYTLVGTGKTPGSAKTKKLPFRQRVLKSSATYTSDRFIPNRTASSAIAHSGSCKVRQMESSSVLTSAADEALSALEGLNINDDDDDDEDNKTKSHSRPSPGTVAFRESLADACGVNIKSRILEFKAPPPESTRPVDLRQQYNRPLKPAASKRRRIPSAPERVLDAPGLVDDYYLNLLDWSSRNQVAIGLERNVYVWSADEGSVQCLMETDAEYVSSVKWSNDGIYLSIGMETGEVQIWNVCEGQKVRSMLGHDTRVGVMGWSNHILSTGSRSGLVYNHDVRVAQHMVAELVSHTSEVCGLEWRSDGAQLATGGNDNLVSIWDARSLSVPKFTKSNHKAAVKALAWCPWNHNLLATGGGSFDRHIHFWNSTSGARVNSIDTGSQVTSIRWNPHQREIVSSGGFPDNSISIWSYPTLVRNIEIPAHESRVLHSCLSPDGQMLATAAADESLKFWKVFEKKAGANGGGAASSKSSNMARQMTIR